MAGTSLLPRTRTVFASLQTKKAMKAGSSFQKKRPSWPVFSDYASAAAGRHIIQLQTRCGFSRNFWLCFVPGISIKNKFKFGAGRCPPSFGFTSGKACAMVPDGHRIRQPDTRTRWCRWNRSQGL